MQIVDVNDLNSGRCIAVYYIGMEKKTCSGGTEIAFGVSMGN